MGKLLSLLLILSIFSCNIEAPERGTREEDFDLTYYTPVEVTDYLQTPGFYSNSLDFSIETNLDKLMGLPVGGGIYAPDHSSVVSLGEAGGYIILKFDPPIENRASYDFIVFGNSFFINGDPSYPNIEYGVVEVMDDNGWSVLIHPDNRDKITRSSKTYLKNDYPQGQWTFGSQDSYSVDVWEILSSVSYKGLADCNPTLEGSPLEYAIPDTPLGGIDNGSGGGDGFDLDWALSSETMEPVALERVSLVKISTASYPGRGVFETEVDAVVRVSP